MRGWGAHRPGHDEQKRRPGSPEDSIYLESELLDPGVPCLGRGRVPSTDSGSERLAGCNVRGRSSALVDERVTDELVDDLF